MSVVVIRTASGMTSQSASVGPLGSIGWKARVEALMVPHSSFVTRGPDVEVTVAFVSPLRLADALSATWVAVWSASSSRSVRLLMTRPMSRAITSAAACIERRSARCWPRSTANAVISMSTGRRSATIGSVAPRSRRAVAAISR